MSDRVALPKAEVNDLGWRSRKQNIEIHGIQETESENLLVKVNEVASKRAVPKLQASEVADVHRLPAKTARGRDTIVRVARQETRDNWLDNRRRLKSTAPKIYIVENITRQSWVLLPIAKNWTKDNDYRFAWHTGNRVFVRRRDGQAARAVKCEEDLLALMSAHG